MADRMKAAAGVSVTYTRTGHDDVPLTVWVGRTLFAVGPEREGAARVEWGERDYLIKADDLLLSGARSDPAEGDRVTQAIDGEDVVFEVMPQDDGPAWRWSDESRSIYRIHCKRVA